MKNGSTKSSVLSILNLETEVFEITLCKFFRVFCDMMI